MAKTKLIPAKLATTRDGDFFLITVPNRWGKGATLADARKALREHAGRRVLERSPWRVYGVHPETYVNEYGQLCFPKGDDTAPIMLAEHDPLPGEGLNHGA